MWLWGRIQSLHWGIMPVKSKETESRMRQGEPFLKPNADPTKYWPIQWEIPEQRLFIWRDSSWKEIAKYWLSLCALPLLGGFPGRGWSQLERWSEVRDSCLGARGHEQLSGRLVFGGWLPWALPNCHSGGSVARQWLIGENNANFISLMLFQLLI